MIEAETSKAPTSPAAAPATSVRDTVRTFVTTNFYVADPSSLGDQASLLDGGVIDSTGVLEVIAFLESEFGFQVADEEMVPDNLDSIANLTAYVGRKTAAA